MFKTICNSIMIGAVSTAAIVNLIYVIRKKKRDKVIPSNARVTDSIKILIGEVIEIQKDEELGLSRIKVKDRDGQIQYGFSSVSVEELRVLYEGKGYVRIPVVSERHIELATEYMGKVVERK